MHPPFQRRQVIVTYIVLIVYGINNNAVARISGTIAPARDVSGNNLTTEQTLKIILSHLNLIVPVVAAILVIIIAIVVVCVVRGARDHHKGKKCYCYRNYCTAAR